MVSRARTQRELEADGQMAMERAQPTQARQLPPRKDVLTAESIKLAKYTLQAQSRLVG